MTLTGGKRKVNKSLKAWVAFVKRVQKEEKLNYKDAIHRAKVRKDKGEKWMVGGADELDETVETETPTPSPSDVNMAGPDETSATLTDTTTIEEDMAGGRRKTRRRGSKSSKKSKKSRKTKRRRTRRH